MFINLIKDLEPVISCLQNTQMEAIAGDAKKRQNGSDAAALSSSILNAKFLLRLTGLANIYSQYGFLVNKVQEVNLLPHERLEGFESANAKLKKMADCVENCNLCPVKDDKKVCYWPDFHAAEATWKEENKICSLVVPDQYEERASIGANTTRSVSRNTSQQSQQNVVESAKKELKLFTERLCKELEQNVFDEDDRKVISQAKVITDLKSIFCAVKQGGTTKVVASKANQYLKAIRKLPIKSLINVPDDVLNAQFNDLVCRIESLVPTNTNVHNIDSKDIIKSLIKESTECCKGIEMLVQAICCASVKVSVESVI